MPTITTALAAESLFQYKTKESDAKNPKGRPAAADSSAPIEARRPLMQRFYYSPELYATPVLAPIPDVSSIALSPTTYVVNHKRRDARPCPPAADRRVDEFEVLPEGGVLSDVDAIALSGVLGGGNGEVAGRFAVGLAGEDEGVNAGPIDNFLEPQVSINVGTSGSDGEDGGSLRSGRSRNRVPFNSLNQDEYYDTAEDFLSDGSFSNSSPSFRSTENEMRILRLTIIEESRRREVAEEKLHYLNELYEKLLKCLSDSTSSLFELPKLECLNEDTDPTELCQEIVLLKFISEALELDLAKDEIEGIFNDIIASKDHEMSRLRDRMLYYEAMNREMSQRNQETVELARKQRLRRRRMKKWIWSCVGFSITAGASLLAYTYLPVHQQRASSSAPPSDTSTVGTE